MLGGAVLGVALLARRATRSCGGFDFEQMIERMPENAPPKWMFRNITTIRDNTERILALLESERTHATGERARVSPQEPVFAEGVAAGQGGAHDV
ncbi:MAG: hypothetical protein ACXVYM_01730 [Gaiellaceae bacterium]